MADYSITDDLIFPHVFPPKPKVRFKPTPRVLLFSGSEPPSMVGKQAALQPPSAGGRAPPPNLPPDWEWVDSPPSSPPRSC